MLAAIPRCLVSARMLFSIVFMLDAPDGEHISAHDEARVKGSFISTVWIVRPSITTRQRTAPSTLCEESDD